MVNFIQVDTAVQLFIEKGVFMGQEFFDKLKMVQQITKAKKIINRSLFYWNGFRRFIEITKLL